MLFCLAYLTQAYCTISVESNEHLSKLLQKAKLPHEVLNEKNHASEAEIIAKAGEIGAITIATNMAGRGTDIKLAPGVKELGVYKANNLAF